MATIKFRIVSKKDVSNIYVRILDGRKLDVQTKTDLFINSKDWQQGKNLPKQNTVENKNITTDLIDLKSFLLKKINHASSNGVEVTKDWLKYNVDLFFKRITENSESDLLTDAIQRIIDEAPTRKNAKDNLGLSKSRINSYKSLLSIITEYQKQQPLKVLDVDVKFSKNFLNYLLNTKQYGKSTALKKLADLKTVCNDAEFYGIKTNPQYKKIQSSKPNNENILFLSLTELEAIQSTVILNEALKNARKWLLLGCNIGQRVSDLLELNESNFVTRNNLEVIELKQQKTGKNVTIPVLDEIKEILKEGLPYKISAQKFNKYIKDVCQLAEINAPTKGTKLKVLEKGKGNKEKRKVTGIYPKWQLMASHVCRRSFCSNLYGVLPTPLIMSISAHSSEKMLLNYIGKDSLDYAQQIADFYTLQSLKKEKKPLLKVIKQAN